MNIKKSSYIGMERTGLRAICAGGVLLSSFSLFANAEESRNEETTTEDVSNVQELDDSTVIANRLKTDLDKVGNTVSVLDAFQLDRQGVKQLDDALKLVPGVISDTSSGQRGAVSSVFIRGNESRYTGVIVDGFRMDGSGGFSGGNFFGTSGIQGLSRIEILKGPQGVLYGASSVSGVLGLSSAKGEGDYSGYLNLEVGSFNSYNSTFGMQGSLGKLSYSLSLGNEQGDNDLLNNEFKSNSYMLRLDYDVNEKLSFGLTTRGLNAETRLPNFADPLYSRAQDDDFDYNLSTVYGKYDVSDIWSSKLTLGYYDQFYASSNPNSGGAQTFSIDSSKFAAYWDNTIVWNESHSTAAGLSYERSKYRTQFSAENNRKQTGLYVNHVWDITDALNISAGSRWTHYEEDAANGFKDDVATWKFASSYKLDKTDTIFRASIGSGFQLPSYFQVYNSTPNNVLEPVKSLGWDIGIEQRFNDGRFTLGATYFETRIDNTIDFLSFSPAGAVYGNRATVNETSGIEVFGKASFLDERLTAVLSYTWLDRQTLAAPSFLAEQTASLRLNYKVDENWNVGMSTTYQGERALFGNALDDYALVNLYTDYKLTDNVTLTARVDNLFDKEYFHGIAPGFPSGQDVRPGSGAGIFAGVTISW